MTDRFRIASNLAQRLAELKVPMAADANSFFRAFSNWEGVTPGEWRMQHRAVA